MKKSLILISALVVLAVLVGCNADQIAGFGKGMEKIGDMGLGTRNNESMNAAVENVKTFIETSEKCFNWPENIDFDDDKDVSAAFVTFIEPDGGKQFRNTISYTIDNLLNAKDSSAKSKELRSALDAKYDGVTKQAKTEKNLYKLFKRCPNLLAGIMVAAVTDESGLFNPAFARKRLMDKGLSKEAVDALVSVLEKNLPMPVSTYDVIFILNLITDNAQSLLEVYQTISGSGGGSGKKLDLTALKNFQEGIAASVGDRDYETVGDRLTFNILYYLIYSLKELNDMYKASEEYEKLDDGHKYDEFFEYVLNNPDGFAFFDRFLNGLQAIGYIYDVKLDVTGLVSNAI